MSASQQQGLHSIVSHSHVNNIALTSYSETRSVSVVTYAELFQRVQTASQLIQSRGIQEDQLVGIVTDMTGEFCVSVLAALATTCSFVYIDPTLPKQRIREMLLKLCPAVLMIQNDFLELCGWVKDFCGSVLAISPDFSCKLTLANPSFAANSYPNIEYVMFTSGSTYHPESVRVPRKCAYDNVQSIGERLQITPSDRCVLASPGSFDPCIVEMFAAWNAGASLHAFPMSAHRSPEKLVRLMQLIKPTVLQCSPSLLYMMASCTC